MKSFNLLDEAWISVMVNEKGDVKDVSLLELFKNAHNYKRLAGETPAQDFAILRFLLAVMYTVFTRFDYKGDQYEWNELDERFIPKEDIDRFDSKKYLDSLYNTWQELFSAEELPEIISTYLNKWRDRFDLYHKKYPFYQISDEDSLNFIESNKNKNVFFNSFEKSGTIYLKTINRRISESATKKALFSPISEDLKNKLSDSELARWLISFQGYTGTSGKAKLSIVKGSASRGWLYSIGAIYLKQDSLKQTLMLNLILGELNDERLKKQFLSKQIPVWEKEMYQKIDIVTDKTPSKLADLFTNLSIFLQIKKTDNNFVFLKGFQIPKFSENFDKKSRVMEPMTIWKKPANGCVEPATHNINKSFWRSFGALALKNSTGAFSDLRPTLIQWKNKLTIDNKIKDKNIEIASIGLHNGGTASNLIIGEIYDSLIIDNEVLLDIKEGDKVEKSGWVKRISDEVIKVEEIIKFTIKKLAEDILEIRNLSNKNNKKEFINSVIQEVYFDIDLPFREWLSSIKIDDKKEEKIALWRSILKKILIKKADSLIENAGNRDYLGKKGKNTKLINVPIAYNNFLHNINKAF